MRCADPEHTIRAATEIIAQDSVIIIDSQAILGSYTEDELPEQATQSVEVDMAPFADDDGASLATRLDAFSVSGQCSTRRTATTCKASAVKPRCSRLDGRPGSHDLCLAKLVAHRAKDLVFVEAPRRPASQMMRA